ncbi:MAG: sugar phosphate isomerase/epimerase family protein [Tepidisphaeraceae bacterium]
MNKLHHQWDRLSCLSSSSVGQTFLSVPFSRRSFLAASVAALSLPAMAEASPWQIGCFTRPWDAFDYRVGLDGIAEAGFRYVGLMTAKAPRSIIVTPDVPEAEVQEIAAEIKQRKLTVVSVYGGNIAIDKSLRDGIDSLKRLIDRCAMVGCQNLMMGGVGSPQLYDNYFKAIAECCGYAADKHMGISMKPHGGLNATGAQCRKAVERVNHPNFRIWYDPGNIFYYSDGKLDPVDDAPSVDGLVAGVSIKDFKLPKEVLLTPGDGQVNFPKVLALLKKGGFNKGPLVIETLRTGDAKQMTAEAMRAREFVESVVKP